MARSPVALLALTGLLCLPPLAAAGDGSAPARLRLQLETPADGAAAGDAEGRVFVSGRALAVDGRAGHFDVLVVIDTSTSTAAPSGADVDGDGYVGRKQGSRLLFFLTWMFSIASDDPGDSILAAEIAAARTLLEQLDPRTTRVGVIAFSGDRRPETHDARVIVPLTSRYAKVAHGLERLLAEGAHGRTNILAAVQTARSELLGDLKALSAPLPDARKVVLFMTDGQPTLPDPRSRMDNARRAIAEAQAAARERLRFDTFAIGESAADDPFVTEGIASVSAGRFTAVGDPRELVAAFEDIDLAELSGLEVHNRTTGRDAAHLAISADGAFSALVELAPGPNRLEIRARSSSGERATRQVVVHHVPGEPIAELGPRLLARRARLLESELLEARARRLTVQSERDDAVLRDLELRMERVRAERRELERHLALDVEDDEPVAGAAGDVPASAAPLD